MWSSLRSFLCVSFDPIGSSCMARFGTENESGLAGEKTCVCVASKFWSVASLHSTSFESKLPAEQTQLHTQSNVGQETLLEHNIDSWKEMLPSFRGGSRERKFDRLHRQHRSWVSRWVHEDILRRLGFVQAVVRQERSVGSSGITGLSPHDV